MKKICRTFIVLLFITGLFLYPEMARSEVDNTDISVIKISATSFNPSNGENVTIFYSLKDKSRVTVDVYDPDHGLIKRLLNNELQAKGNNQISWSGKNEKDAVVPNEAYFFTIEAITESNEKGIYDPTTFSGGIEHDITKSRIDPMAKTLTYRMPEMGRVMIRIGIKGGPLMRNLVQWEPRIAGEVTEYWNGMDENNLINIRNDPNFKMIVTYFTLPENSFITYGNKDISYRDYRASNIAAAVKEKRPRKDSQAKLSPHYELSRLVDYAPHIHMTFPQAEENGTDDIPVIKGKTLVKVELDKDEKDFFTNQQYEVAFFLDNVFYAEEEVGYSPYNWGWDLSNVEAGDHVLTVNISSFKDQVAVLSRKVKVVK